MKRLTMYLLRKAVLAVSVGIAAEICNATPSHYYFVQMLQLLVLPPSASKSASISSTKLSASLSHSAVAVVVVSLSSN